MNFTFLLFVFEAWNVVMPNYPYHVKSWAVKSIERLQHVWNIALQQSSSTS